MGGHSWDDNSEGGKVSDPAQPEQVVPGQAETNSGDASQEQPAEAQEGVKVGGLSYTTNDDGTRSYSDQEPVETVDDPTPQPEQVQAEAPQQTDQPVGQ
jgi:hypothetical protein